MDQSRPQITVYGATWCPDAQRSRRFLDSHGISYRWVDVDENPEGRAFVVEANKGQLVIPVIVFPDGTFLVEPSDERLAERLGREE